MRRAAVFLLTLVGGCASSGQGDVQALIAGREFLSGGTYVFYGANGSVSTDSGSEGSYAVLGNQICVRWQSGQGRCDSLTREGDDWYVTDSQQRRYPFSPIEATLRGVGRVRDGTECQSLGAEFPAVMRLSRRSWIVVVSGRTYNRGNVSSAGKPLNAAGEPLRNFLPGAYTGFSRNGGCTIDWDLWGA